AEEFYFDPATLEVSTSHIINGDRVVDLGASHIHDDKIRPQVDVTEWPVPRLNMRLKAQWEQRAVGHVDVAPMIGSRHVWTLSPDWLERQAHELPGGSTEFLGSGWTLAGSVVRLLETTQTDYVV